MPRRFIDGQLAPVVDAAAGGKRRFRPRVGSDLALLGHAVERPHEFAGADVVRVRVSGVRNVVRAAGRQRDDEEVLEDSPGVAGLQRPHASDVPVETEPHVHLALVAERFDRLAGGGIDGGQEPGVDEEQPAIRPVGALPVIDPTVADGALVLVRPDFLARRRVERDERHVLREDVHHAVDDDRVETVRPGVAGRNRSTQPGAARRSSC